ncbi:MAG: 16S rRNA (cytidine(1402)-2'-O)-methyltransferase [Bacteroidota bacterium]|jgi:16S rRNA (cytidine1402-2'-O)-methyltransferase|nr:16S rRNA (cytidine(1402)-2'-O)-methyltransferase [Bacteroidota bacterium]|tara:strand:+ start:507 stop:1184 length:678 start_codon:yes stop_codon:yes gene_type:complete
MSSNLCLSIVPTPIGNLNDITYRAIKVLKDSDIILCEDTRISKRLLDKYSIDKPLYSYHIHNEHKVVEKYIQYIISGKKVSLISDAGTPGISDPGYLIIRESIKKNIEIDCLPGPTAFVPALINSGISSDKFVFEGFLPKKKGRMSRIEFLKEEKRSIIIYESPHRIKRLIEELKAVFGGQRLVSISRELSKIHQENIRGTLDEVDKNLESKNIKGEVILIINGV